MLGLRCKKIAIWLIALLAFVGLTAIIGLGYSVVFAIIIFMVWIITVIAEYDATCRTEYDGKSIQPYEPYGESGDDDWYYEARFIWRIFKDH